MLIKIYDDNPNVREVRRVADRLRGGATAIVPTDTIYAFACSIEFKQAAETIARLKGFKLKQAKYSILCSSLSMASEYIRPLDNSLYAMLRQCLPGPYTFILQANNTLNRNYLNANKTIGVRVPNNNVVRAIIDELGCPLIATSVRTIGDEIEPEYLTDPELIHETYCNQIDMVVDGGTIEANPSTVVDCSSGEPMLVRLGKGPFEI